MKKYYLLLLMTLPLFGLSFNSCSDDDDVLSNNQEEIAEPEPVDELGTLQSSLVRISDSGAFEARVFGVSLDAADTTEVSAGVSDFAEAKSLFRSWFADTTQVSQDGTLAEFTTETGSAQLIEESDGKGRLGYVKFNVPGLKYVSRVNFIQSDAWPENASGKGFHKFGVQYQYTAWTGDPTPAATDRFDRNKLETFVCVREYKDGVPALLVGLSDADYYLHWRRANQYGGNMPNKDMASNISSILRSDWENYKKLFNANGRYLLADGWEYWIHSGKDIGALVYRDVIKLQTGKFDRRDVHWKKPNFRVLFYILSGQRE